jgi:hypothetical protein
MTTTPAANGSWLEKLGYVTLKNEGTKAAASQGFGTIKDGVRFWNPVSDGKKLAAFGKVTGIGVGVAVAGDALFRSKTADGEDRGLLARLGEFVLGTGIAAASLLRGGR